MSELHYSSTALVKRCGMMMVAALVVIADYVAHADGGFPRVFGLGFVPSATLLAVALYLVGVTIVLTIGLARHGGVAVARTADGLVFHSAWFSKHYAWADFSRIALEERYGKYSHHPVIAVHDVSGLVRCHAIDTRLLNEPLTDVNGWVQEAERQRIGHGGAHYAVPATDLAGYNAQHQAADLAADLNARDRAPYA